MSVISKFLDGMKAWLHSSMLMPMANSKLLNNKFWPSMFTLRCWVAWYKRNDMVIIMLKCTALSQ
jgi:hypothetical protein